jgi:hypothetical protein
MVDWMDMADVMCNDLFNTMCILIIYTTLALVLLSFGRELTLRNALFAKGQLAARNLCGTCPTDATA